MIELDNIYNGDAKAFMDKNIDKESIDLIFSDPPYNLGSIWTINDYGHYKLKGKGSDFNNKWEVMDGEWWYQWFVLAHKILKPGGFMILFNIDRQSDLFSYYARKSGFEILQKLYWLFLDNFPKARILDIELDKKLGTFDQRELVKGIKGKNDRNKDSVLAGLKTKYEISLPAHPIAKKYEGYKYSISPFKQMLEEILIFRKPMRTKKPISDLIIMKEKHNRLPVKNLHLPLIKSKPPYKRSIEQDRFTSQLFLHKPVGKQLIKHFSHEQANRVLDLTEQYEYNKLDAPYLYQPKVKERDDFVGMKDAHVTVKPLSLCKRIIELFTLPGKEDIIYDPFSGSGTIPFAAKSLGFHFLGTELNPKYYELAIKKLNYSQQTLWS